MLGAQVHSYAVNLLLQRWRLISLGLEPALYFFLSLTVRAVKQQCCFSAAGSRVAKAEKQLMQQLRM